MRLTTLGTGTVALSPSRVCSGQLVQAGTVTLLMDCGSGVVHRMAEHALPWREITHVAFTHFHLDHIGDFATLMFAWKYGDRPGRSAPLVVIGPAGTAALLGRFADAVGSWFGDPGFAVSVQEIEPGGSIDLGDSVMFGATKVPHTPESVAYSITRAGRRIVYSGDTGYDPAFGQWARGADLLLCECSLPAEQAMAEHLTPAECGALAVAAQPKQLVLTHFYPSVERTDIRGSVARHYAGPVSLAEDGNTFEIEED